MVTLQTGRRLLWAVLATLLAAVAACAAAGLWLPLATSAGAQAKAPDTQPATGPACRSAEPLDHYAVIYQRDLRRPIHDPKPVVIVKPEPPKPKLTVSLVGTACDPGFECAMLKGKFGQVKLVPIGQSYEDAEVVAVTRDAATVKFHGDTITLTFQAREGTP